MTCKDCVHYEVCRHFVDLINPLLADHNRIDINENTDICKEHFQDRSRFVELPCKVGDTIYSIENIAGEWTIIKDHVETIGIGYYADGVNLYQFDGIKTDGYFEDFGKTVFLTRKEAEQALKERENNG